MGMQGLLSKRSGELTGILNGIDDTVWNPARDHHIARRYDSDDIEGKSENKRALRAQIGLPQAELPLLAMVSRLTGQKGVDLLVEAAPEIARLPAQLVVLGTGEKHFESALQDLARAFPAEISVTIGFDERLAHLIEAGADIFLMPSRYEPCGMNQMYSQRYGTIPVVRATGGLLDSVQDFSHDGDKGTGFIFTDATAAALLSAIKRSVEVYASASWRKLQLNAMERDFSWGRAAAQYFQIYERLIESARQTN
jgi:starch synthase